MLILDIVIEFIKTNPWMVLTNVVMMLFVPLNEVLLPHLYGKMINDISTSDAARTLFILVVVLIVVQLGFLLRDKINGRFVPAFEAFIKSSFLEAILRKHEEALDELTTGDIIYRLTKAPEIFIYWFQWINDYIVPYILVFLTALVYFAKYDPMIAVTYAVFLLVLAYMFVSTPRSCLEQSKKSDTTFSALHERIEDVIHNMPSIYTLGTKNEELQRLRDHGVRYSDDFARTTACSRSFKATMLPVTVSLISFFVIRSMSLLKSGRISKPKFVSTFLIMTSMLGSVFWLVDIMRYSVLDMGCLSNIDDYLVNANSESKESQSQSIGHNLKSNTIDEDAPRNVLGVRDLTVSYDNRGVFESPLSIDFQEGKTTALVGPVGSGKSTLFKVLLKFLKPRTGDAYLYGTWYRDLDAKDVRDSIGYVPQNPVLFNESTYYNISYGNGVSREKAEEVVEAIGYDKEFLDRNVGKNGMHLSGGQRQLVWCLRVLFSGTPIVLMDEPTASMDEASKDALVYVLSMLLKERTIIVVTHDPYLLGVADVVQHIN